MNLRSSVSKEKGRKLYRVQCIPFYSLILAMGNPTIHYFSLDVEGAELAVLRTIPWQSMDIRTLSVEVAHSDKRLIKRFMVKQGFRVLARLKADYIFVKEGDPNKSKDNDNNNNNNNNNINNDDNNIKWRI